MTTTKDIGADKPDLSGHRVLLVEDEYYIADDLRCALEGSGADVVGPVPSVAKALLLAESEQLTCAVLDINLRGESGFKVAEMLRRRNVPFIFSTGYQVSMIPDDLKGAMHLEKPFRVDDLLRAILEATQHPRGAC